MQIQIKVFKNSIAHFQMDVCAFKDRPSDIEVLTGNDYCVKGLIFMRKYSDDDYDYYLSDFDIAEGVNYLGGHMVNYYALHYLSFKLLKN